MPRDWSRPPRRFTAPGGLQIDLDRLEAFTPEQQDQVREQLEVLEREFRENPLLRYNNPLFGSVHPKQLEFHRPPFPPVRAFFGGNRSGKTTAAILDTIVQVLPEDLVPEHLLAFKRWSPPVKVRVVTPDLTSTLDGVIHEKIREWTPRKAFRNKSFDGAWDKVQRILRFECGSWIQFNSSEQDREKLGGVALHRVVYDEEPRQEVRNECAMRLVDYDGEEIFALTPFSGMCVDTETECLTRRGWRRHNELEIGEPVLTYDVSNGVTEWAPLLGVYRDEKYAGSMLRTPGHLDSMFTPEHKWVTPQGLVPWQDLKKSDPVIVAAPHSNLNADWFGDPPFWELVGWFLAEGSVVRDENKMVIYQSASRYPEHCERIAGLLRRLDVQYHVGDQPYRSGSLSMVAGVQRRFVITGDVARRLKWVVGYPKRLRPEIVASLSAPSLEALLEGLLGGDGHMCASGKWEFTTCDWEMADAVSMIGVLLGRRTNIRRYFSPSISERRGRRPVFRVTGSGRERVVEFKRRAVPAVAPDGGVWCPCTPNRTWVARRGGTAFITGNSWLYDQIYEPWELALEKHTPAEAEELLEMRVLTVDMDDNPHLSETGKARQLAKYSGPEREARKSGRFVQFSGRIFPQLPDVIPEPDRVPAGAEVFRGVDPGWRHMLAVVYCWLTPDDELVVFDEIALRGATVKQACDEMKIRDLRWGARRDNGTVLPLRSAWTVIDPSSRNRNAQTGRSDQQEFADHGVYCVPGQNAVEAGINRVKERIDARQLVVSANCTELLSQFKRYRWVRHTGRTEHEARAEPVKKDDHLLDALRYVVAQRPLAPPVPKVPVDETTQQRMLRRHMERIAKFGRRSKVLTSGYGPGQFS